MFEEVMEDSWNSKELWYKVNADKSSYKMGFQDGYNKANEWHYVKDGDYPPCEKGSFTINVLTDRGEIAYYDYNLKCWVVEPSSAEIDPPTAWCYIPKFEE